ncbi:hypothetical protein K1719_001095 [Acacia pycnantha]|nr:hypothetical protein K1719_001095 [Acacia pycnantha]
MQLHFSVSVSFFIISITLYQIPICFCDDYEASCSSLFDCGNIKNISYPFWGSERPEYCGHPEFKLDCHDDYAEITIMSYNYRVLQVNYSDYSLRVVRTDFWNNSCPTYFKNNSIDFTLFEYRGDSHNLTLLYDCPSPPSSLTYFRSTQLNCSEYGTEVVSYFLTEVPEIDATTGTCAYTLIVPILESQVRILQENSTVENLKAAIHEGFGLVWEADKGLCYDCRTSGGQCGYNTSLSEFTCYCRDGPVPSTCRSRKTHQGTLLAIAISAGAGGLALISVLIIYIKKKRFRTENGKIFGGGRDYHDHNLQSLMRNYGSLAPKKYSYSEVKRMTKSFSNKLGEGGYGVVYKASLPDGRLVAVKVIRESKGSGEEFLNEVASISRTSHVNIVTLLGFCFERNKGVLIYEYMSNGSLDNFIYKRGSPNAFCTLEWKVLYQVAIGIARGLEYLHRGCNTRILHLDIKPQNILLDEEFSPKISDFGLAKICQKRESIVSILGTRGTIGFIAPELFNRAFGGVSHKADVYSYGMLVLEMVGGRKNYDSGGSQTDELYFPDWIYKDLEHGKHPASSVVITVEDDEMVRKMTLVSLWCIQTNPFDRPAMSKVVEMLEGPLQSLSVPPKPTLQCPTKSTVTQLSSGSSQELTRTNSITG